MTEVAIEIEAVTKRFRIYHQHASSLKERVIGAGRNAFEEFYALSDVSFDVNVGETVGLLGHNGSGKSTLLKCVAGTLRPTSGRIRTRGRVAALLELGAGFHPELTGRENVYLNGSILGLSSAEIDAVFDDIVAFAELEKFIDNQVKHFSSGMYARLGFAVAVNVDPDILLIDEVLAVGDEAFQRKCLDRIRRFSNEGRTILVVSHSAGLLRQVCDRVAVLDHGELLTYDSADQAVETFREALMANSVVLDETSPIEELGTTQAVWFAGVELTQPRGEELRPGDPLTVTVRYKTEQPTDDVMVSIVLQDLEGVRLLGTNTSLLGLELGRIESRGEVRFEFDSLPLRAGTYLLSFNLQNRAGTLDHDRRIQQDAITIVGDDPSSGLVHFPLRAHRVDLVP
jgi:ABC-2 type transport system ATP-binding protein